MGAAAPALGSGVEVDMGAGLVEIIGAQDIKVTFGQSHTTNTGGLGDVTDTRCGTGTQDAGDLEFSDILNPLNTVHQWLIDRKVTNAGLNTDGTPIDFRVTVPGGVGSTTDQLLTGSGTIMDLGQEIAKKGVWTQSVKTELDDQWAVTHAT